MTSYLIRLKNHKRHIEGLFLITIVLFLGVGVGFMVSPKSTATNDNTDCAFYASGFDNVYGIRIPIPNYNRTYNDKSMSMCDILKQECKHNYNEITNCTWSEDGCECIFGG